MIAKNITPKAKTEKDSFHHESDENERSPKQGEQDHFTTLVKGFQDFDGPVIENWTDTYLETDEHGKRKKLYIYRYFTPIMLAMDKFYTQVEYTLGNTEFKKKVLNEHGIRYMVLTPIVTFTEAYNKAMSQKVN